MRPVASYIPDPVCAPVPACRNPEAMVHAVALHSRVFDR
jgi:hypothetical protein